MKEHSARIVRLDEQVRAHRQACAHASSSAFVCADEFMSSEKLSHLSLSVELREAQIKNSLISVVGN